MERLQVGSIVFFNHGKKLELPLSYSENTSDLDSKIKQSLFSREEAKFLSNLLGFEVKEGNAFDAKLYKKLTKQGFSILRIMPKIKQGSIIETSKTLTAIISDKVQKEDAENLLNYYSKIEQDNKDIELEKQIYVYDNQRYFYNAKTEQGDIPNQALRIFLGYKTLGLSESDKDLMDKYLNFDMQDVFLADTKDRALSHKNEGVILITPKGTIYSSTKKKEQHKYEAIEVMKNDLGIEINDEEAEADVLAKTYNLVIIKLYKTDRNVAAVFCPKEMSIKQLDGLIECMKEFGRINLSLRLEGKMPILTLVDGNQFIETDIGETASVDNVLQKMLQYEKSKKYKGLLSSGINWIKTSVGSFNKYLENVRESRKIQGKEEQEGR